MSDQAEGLRVIQGGGGSNGTTQRRLGAHRVIAVTGGKGGVGKSSIAVNLATLHALRGARTLALDGDLGMPDLNLLLGIAPSRTVIDLIDGMPLRDILVEAHGVSLLPGLAGSTELAELDGPARATLMRALDRLSESFDSMIVDTAAGIGQTVMELASAADDIVVVVTPEPMSIADAYGCLKALHNDRQVKQAFVVANTVRSPAEAADTVERLATLATRFLDVQLIPLPPIPYDRTLADSAAEGIPCVLRAPECPASRALRRMAERLEALSTHENRRTCLPGWRTDRHPGVSR